ncbi:hypothetical protein [Gayadomonas joobiniege]|uniref:hypothetical protein n=1 Tax=Gayadomonas joobiniege TaxID=1234606 RepID=UPI0003648FD6|nr:hypothetical protein [Gayadomonas joobiniege]
MEINSIKQCEIPFEREHTLKEAIQDCKSQNHYLDKEQADGLAAVVFLLIVFVGFLATFIETKKDPKLKGPFWVNIKPIAFYLAAMLSVLSVCQFFIGKQLDVHDSIKQCEDEVYENARSENICFILWQTETLKELTIKIDGQTREVGEQSKALGETVDNVDDKADDITKILSGLEAKADKLNVIALESHKILKSSAEKAAQKLPEGLNKYKYHVALTGIDAKSQCEKYSNDIIYWNIGVDGKQLSNVFPKQKEVSNESLTYEQIKSLDSSYSVVSLEKLGETPKFNLYGYVRYKTGETLFLQKVLFPYKGTLDRDITYVDGKPSYPITISAATGCDILLTFTIDRE